MQMQMWNETNAKWHKVSVHRKKADHVTDWVMVCIRGASVTSPCELASCLWHLRSTLTIRISEAWRRVREGAADGDLASLGHPSSYFIRRRRGPSITAGSVSSPHLSLSAGVNL